VGSLAKNLQYLKRCKIEPVLLCRTNRKSDMCLRFVPKSMTLDDLVWPKRTLAEKSFYRDHKKNLNEDRQMLSMAKYRSVILVSRNIRFVRIFAGVP